MFLTQAFIQQCLNKCQQYSYVSHTGVSFEEIAQFAQQKIQSAIQHKSTQNITEVQTDLQTLVETIVVEKNWTTSGTVT